MKLRSKKNAKKTQKKNRKGSGQGGPKNWPKYFMAMGTMGALLTCAPVSCFAESPGGATIAPRVFEAIYGTVQSQQTQRFDIPPGPLETVLASFQKLTDLQ